MKIDLSQLAQDKKKLAVVALLTAGLLVVALFLVLKGQGGGDTAGGTSTYTGPTDRISTGPGANAGTSASPDDEGDEDAAPPTPPAGATAPDGEATAGDAPRPASADPFAASASAGDGKSFPKGEPVEPYREDPFVPRRAPQAPAWPMILPPVVVAVEPPKPLVLPSTVNVIPASVVAQGPSAIQSELQRRLSGVVWNGRVAAILETPENPQQRSVVVQPGDRLSQGLVVHSITRDQLVLVEQGSGSQRQIVVDLKPAPKAPAMGLGPMGEPMGGAPAP